MQFNGLLGILITLLFVSSASAKMTPLADDVALKSQLKVSVIHWHHAVGYSAARVDLLGTMALSQVGNQYVVTDVYCEKAYPSPGPSTGSGIAIPLHIFA